MIAPALLLFVILHEQIVKGIAHCKIATDISGLTGLGTAPMQAEQKAAKVELQRSSKFALAISLLQRGVAVQKGDIK